MDETILSEKTGENENNLNPDGDISNNITGDSGSQETVTDKPLEINDDGKEMNNEMVSEEVSDEVSEEESGNRFQEFFSERVEADNPKMTEVLKIFLQMRDVDEELFEIEEEKGDLPENIDSIRSKIESLETKLGKKKNDQKETDDEKLKLEADNASYEERINKYDEQKYDVRSNNEYDEIVKTIESLFEEVKKNEFRIKEINANADAITAEINELESKYSELKTELDEKQALLNELNEQFQQEDIKLKEKRSELSTKLDPQSSALYERINKMHNGEATAIVRKSNCSGCYNSIPPQRVIEIKAAEKVYTCQSCGRILISEELMGS